MFVIFQELMKLDFPPNHNKYKAEQGEASQKNNNNNNFPLFALPARLGRVSYVKKNEQNRAPLLLRNGRVVDEKVPPE